MDPETVTPPEPGATDRSPPRDAATPAGRGMGPRTRLRPYDHLAVQLVASGRKHTDIAREVGISDRTLRRRLQDGNFQAEVVEARKALVNQASGQAAALTERAMETLRSLLDADEAALKLRTALAVLDLAHRGVEVADLQQDLGALKRSVATLLKLVKETQ